MSDCDWEEIHAFSSPGEFRRFVRWIETQVQEGHCEEILDRGGAAGPWDDRRFRCISSNEIWKLACPDPGYFAGSWLPEAPSDPGG